MDNKQNLATLSLLSGAAGASALTALHEGLRRSVPAAPRMDVLGRRAIAGMMQAAGAEPLKGNALQSAALGGDLIANSLFYALVAFSTPRRAPAVGTALGLVAGIGAVVLPKPLGLGSKPSARTMTTSLLTIGLYAAGGAVAGLTYQRLARSGR